MKKSYYLKNIVTLKLNVNKCNGCGMCIVVCPHAVFQIMNNKAEIVDRDACMECGACAQNCPVEAIEVRAGVGCASAIIAGSIKGTEPTCGCSCDKEKTCC